MSAREYQTVITKLRNRCKKHDAEYIYLSRIDKDNYMIHGNDWEDTIEVNPKLLNSLIETGFLRLENKQNIEFISTGTIENLIINKHVLYKKYVNHGIQYVLPTIIFTGGILIIIVSIVFYLLKANSVGYVNYSYTGNSVGHNIISWVEMLVFGIILVLIAAYVRFKQSHKI